MKKKNVVKLLSIFAMASGLVACNNGESPATPTPSNTVAPTTETKPSEQPKDTTKASTSESTSQAEKFDDLSPDLENDPIPAPTADVPVEEALAEGTETRSYNDALDRMVNDFSAKVADDKVTGATTKVDAPYLEVRVNTANEVAPVSEDASIYKLGTGSYQIQDGYSIGFKRKLADNKTIDNNHLVLALRGDDSLKTFPIALSKAKNPDGEDLPTLTGEYQEFVISPRATLENENTPYANKDGSNSSRKVLEKILGFHLYAAGNADCTIDIESVFLRKEGAADIILDNFEHAKPNDADASICWWRDSTGHIVGRNVTVKEGGSFSQDISADSLRDNLVVGIKGDTASTSIAFVGAEKTITKNWADLKNSQGEALSAPLKNSYTDFVINLENSGIDIAPSSIKVVSTSVVTINEIFFSDLVTRTVEEYPAIDKASAKVFDDFNRTQTSIDGDYEASNTNPVVTGAGLDYVLSYSNADKVKIENGNAIFDATNLPENGYINLKIGSDLHKRTNEDFLVFSRKLEGEASRDGFRFVTNGEQWAKNWLAAFGVKSLDTPYTKDKGYSLYVIDLNESGIDFSNTLDRYYCGKGKVYIDQVFLTNEYIELEKNGEDHAVTFADKDLSNYDGTGFNISSNVVALNIKGDGVKATLKSIRFAYAGDVKWIKDGVIFDQYGHALDKNHVISADGETIYIDINNSGWVAKTEPTEFYVHVGAFDGSEGTFTLVSYAEYNYKRGEYIAFSNEITAATNNYTYIGWLGADRTNYDHIYRKAVVKGDGKATLDNLRIGAAGSEYWVNTENNAARKQLYLEDGTVLEAGKVISAEGETIIFDLTKSGVSFDGATHLHYSDSVGGVRKFESVSLLSYRPTYEAVYNYFCA